MFNSLYKDKVIRYLKSLIGYKKGVDFSNKNIHPISAKYMSGNYDEIVSAKVEVFRSLRVMGFSCEKYSGNPFIKMLQDYGNGLNTSYDNSSLKIYFDLCQPKSIAEVFELPKEITTRKLEELPAISAVFPWDNYSPESIISKRNKWSKIENRQYSKSENITGVNFFGPVSKIKGQIEYKRLINIYNSIKKNGYICGDYLGGDISGYLMIDGDDYKIIVDEGNHRISACSALNYKEIRVRIKGIRYVLRSEIKYWPNVINKLYTPVQADYIFQKIFVGKKLQNDFYE